MTDSSQPLRIGQLLDVDKIQLQLKSSQRDALLEELVAAVPELMDRPEDRLTLLKALQDREQLHSTGIGEGVALPHARNALVGLVDSPIVAMGRHPQGIPFGAIDGVPARLFFLLVAPTVSQHLQILARISRLLRAPRLRENLFQVETPEAAMELIRKAEAAL